MNRSSNRFVFIAPHSSGPAGGIKTLVDINQILVQNGYRSVVIADKPKELAAQWGHDGLNLAMGESGQPGVVAYRPEPGDIVFFPEVTPAHAVAQIKDHKILKVVFVQNHFYMVDIFPDRSAIKDLGIDMIIASSNVIKEFVRKQFKRSPVPVLPYAVESYGLDHQQRPPIIAVMPRKRPLEYKILRWVFQNQYPALAHYHWIVLHNRPHCDVISGLRQARFFVSLQQFEGFGLPALEAMACGAVVVGFTGQGGEDYATHRNGIWVAEQAIEELAKRLSEIARDADEDPASLAGYITAGQQTANLYTTQAREQAVVSLADELIRRYAQKYGVDPSCHAPKKSSIYYS